MPLAYLRELCAYWADGYDWRATEARLNAVPGFRAQVDGIDIHLLHVRSPHPDAMPLVMTHGWPGSVVEYLEVVAPLTDPPDPADAFHLVIPSLPGYGFSEIPAEPGWGVERIARAWAALMAGLGYTRYGAAGGDWGTSITTSIGEQDAEHVAGIHVIPPIAPPDPETFDDLSAAERASLRDLEEAGRSGSGYSGQMATRPQTVAYGLDDSPVALCAWIVEKLLAWTDGDALTRDAMLDDVTLYWLTGTGGSSGRLYRESFAQVSAWFTEEVTDAVTVPTGCSIFPGEIPRPSRRWAARRYTDIRHWNELDRGGHFAAWEQPDLFVDEVRAFFRLVR